MNRQATLSAPTAKHSPGRGLFYCGLALLAFIVPLTAQISFKVKSHQKISDTAGNFFAAFTSSDWFGSSVAAIGDLDGDGIPDLAVGVPRDDDGGTDRGAVYVLFMNANGTVKSHAKISDTAGDFTAVLDNSDWFGSSVASLGDLDGNGVPDLAVGAYLDDDGGTDRGAVYTLFFELNMQVTSVSPQPFATGVDRTGNVLAVFDMSINESTINRQSIGLRSRMTGLLRADSAYTDLVKSIVLNPATDLLPGDELTVSITRNLLSVNANPLADAYTYTFHIGTDPGTGGFVRTDTVALADSSTDLVLADIDGDGDLDIIATAGAGVALFANDGTGSFSGLAGIGSLGGPRHLATGDWDSDYDLDIAVTDTVSDRIIILANNGSGGFSQAQIISAPAGSKVGLVAADFSGDGVFDLAYIASTTDSLVFLINDGSGIFSTDTVRVGLGTDPVAVIAGDFDNDQLTDIMVANYGSSNLTLVKGDPACLNCSILTLAVAPFPSILASGDWDRDGDLDLAILHDSTKTVTIYRNNGNDTFTLLATHAVGLAPAGLIANDWNGDGYLDLAVSNSGQQDLTILKNDGAGAFNPIGVARIGPGPTALAAGDLDGDNHLELAVVLAGASEIAVLRGNQPLGPRISLSTTTHDWGYVPNGDTSAFSLKIFNQGVVDSLVISGVVSSNSDITFEPATGVVQVGDSLIMTVTFAPTSARQYVDSLTISSNDTSRPAIRFRMDGVGIPGLVAATPASGSNSAGQTDAIEVTFTDPIAIDSLSSGDITVFGSVHGVYSGSISSNSFDNTAIIFKPGQPFQAGEEITVILTERIQTGTGIKLQGGQSWRFSIATLFGTGEFSRETALDQSVISTGSWKAVSGDFTGDDVPDIAVANIGGKSITIMRNDQGTGLVALSPLTVTGSGPLDVLAGDLDSDGDLDLVSVNDDDLIYLWRNDSPGFSLAGQFSAGTGLAEALLIDLNNDGLLDIASLSKTGNKLNLFENDGAWGFTGTDSIALPAVPINVVAGDFDGDGFSEFFISLENGSIVHYRRTGGAAWARDTTYTLSPNVTEMRVAEMNGDGKFDLVAVTGNGNVHVFLNDGAGNLQSPNTHGGIGSGTALFASDFDADGDVDIGTVDFNTSKLLILANNGDGVMTATDTISVGVNPTDIVGINLRRSGLTDLAVITFFDTELILMLNKTTVSTLVQTSLDREGEQYDSVKVNYSLYDDLRDSLGILVEYSVTSGVWNPATVLGDTASLPPDAYDGAFTWAAVNDLTPKEYVNTALRVTPYSNSPGQADTLWFNLDNLHPEAVTISLADTLSEYSDTVRFAYTLTDTSNDTLQLTAAYQVAGDTVWHAITKLEGATNLDTSKYSGTLSWASYVDFTGLDVDSIWVRFTPTDGGPGGKADTTDYFRLDNNRAPTVAIDTIKGERSGDVPVYYTLADTENDTLTLLYFYSSDSGATWDTTSTYIIGTNIDTSQYADTLIWNSREIFDGQEVSEVRIQMLPVDGDTGTAAISTVFRLDNLHPHTIQASLVDTLVEYSDTIAFSYTLADTSLDTLGIIGAYQVEGDTVWTELDGLIAASGLDTSKYVGEVRWNSAADLEGMDIDSLWIRLSPTDGWRANAPDTLGPISLDNNRPPVAIITDITEEQTGDVALVYQLSDAEGDSLAVTLLYSSDGSSWSAATVTGDTTGLLAGTDTLVWNSNSDLPAVDLPAVMLRLIPRDLDTGTADTSAGFHLDNYHLHSSVLSFADTLAEYSDSIRYQVELVDTTYDILSLRGYYQIADSAWQRATIVGDTSGLDSSKYSQPLIWDSRTDLPGVDADSVRFSIVPYDSLAPGIADTTAWFHLDNNGPPVVAFGTMSGEFSGDFTLAFTLVDSDDDSVNLTIRYQVDADSAWQVPTLLQDTLGFAVAGTGITWRSGQDIVGLDFDSVTVAILPMDNDVGTADTVILHIDNNPPPSITIGAMPGEYIVDIAIPITTADAAPSDSVTLTTFYRISGNAPWLAATVTDNLRKYATGQDSVVWMNQNDLNATFVGSIDIKIVPYDIDEGTADSITIFVNISDAPRLEILSQLDTEQSGDVTMNYAITDNGQETIGLSLEYSTNGGSTWNTSNALAGNYQNISSGQYNNSLIWKSASDLPGVDFEGVLVKVTPADDVTGVPDTVGPFHLDNNAVPSLLVDTFPETITTRLRIPVKPIDIENDVVMMTADYSLDNSNWFPATLMDGRQYPLTLESNDILDWDVLADIGYQRLSNTYFRMIPSDNDIGVVSQYDGISIKIWPADYNGDLRIGPADLIIFAVAWEDQLKRYDIGPATWTTTLEDISVIGDGVIDFEDLMIFGLMWDWSFEQNGLPKKIIASRKAADAKYASLTQRISDNPWETSSTILVDLHLTSVPQLLAMEGIFDFQGAEILVGKLETGPYLSRGFENTALLTHVPDDTSRMLFGMVGLGSKHGSKEPAYRTSDPIVTLSVISMSDSPQLIALDLILYDKQGTEVSVEHLQVAVENILPKEFALHQNFPNPFNPVTTIRYELPKASKVQLRIYNLLGREVIRLVNEDQPAGYHKFIWDGRDRLGKHVSSGIYITRMVTPKYAKTIKMVLLK